MRITWIDAFLLSGYAMLVAGIWMISVPAALIVGGALLMVLMLIIQFALGRSGQ